MGLYFSRMRLQSYSMTATRSPAPTVSPFVTQTLFTVPATGAATAVSIFMALSTHSFDPTLTLSPTAHFTSITSNVRHPLSIPHKPRHRRPNRPWRVLISPLAHNNLRALTPPPPSNFALARLVGHEHAARHAVVLEKHLPLALLVALADGEELHDDRLALLNVEALKA
jgi:hypothetical protein